MKGKHPNNLKAIMDRERVGTSELARRVGTSKQNIDRWAAASRKLPIEWALKLAPALSTTPEQLVFPPRKVPIVGYVGAGAKVYSIDDAEMGAGSLGEADVDAPLDLGPDAVAVKVKGDSMRPAYRDGDLIFYDRRLESDFESLIGEECVVELEDGSHYVKEVYLGSAAGQWTLLSHNASPIPDVRLRWAARVRYIERA